jgi:hypothetical protein
MCTHTLCVICAWESQEFKFILLYMSAEGDCAHAGLGDVDCSVVWLRSRVKYPAQPKNQLWWHCIQNYRPIWKECARKNIWSLRNNWKHYLYSDGIRKCEDQTLLWKAGRFFVCGLFYDCFSVPRPYSVDDGSTLNDVEWTRANIYALCGIRTHGLSVQAIMAYASDRVVAGTGSGRL